MDHNLLHSTKLTAHFAFFFKNSISRPFSAKKNSTFELQEANLQQRKEKLCFCLRRVYYSIKTYIKTTSKVPIEAWLSELQEKIRFKSLDSPFIRRMTKPRPFSTKIYCKFCSEIWGHRKNQQLL